MKSGSLVQETLHWTSKPIFNGVPKAVAITIDHQLNKLASSIPGPQVLPAPQCLLNPQEANSLNKRTSSCCRLLGLGNLALELGLRPSNLICMKSKKLLRGLTNSILAFLKPHAVAVWRLGYPPDPVAVHPREMEDQVCNKDTRKA